MHPSNKIDNMAPILSKKLETSESASKFIRIDYIFKNLTQKTLKIQLLIIP